jgi:hypothetical protein
MSVARIAAIVVVLTGVAVAAQSLSSIALKVKVTDTAGNVIPRALIRAHTSDSGIASETETDAQGEALLYLKSDASTISASALGFESWRSTIDLRQDPNHFTKIELRVAGMGPGVTVEASPLIPTERASPAALISPEPLESLIDLPAHKLQHRQLHSSHY